MTSFVGSEGALDDFGHPKHVALSALQSWADFQFEARRGALDKQVCLRFSFFVCIFLSIQPKTFLLTTSGSEEIGC